MESLRQQIQETFGSVDLSGGLRKSFFAPVYLERPDLYPYQSNGRISLRKTIEGWKWPLQSDYVRLDDYPEKEDTGFAEKLQGVTHFEDRCWIFSQDPAGVQGQLTSVDIRENLDDYSTVTSTVVTETNRAFNNNAHYGDCSLDDGLLVVPNHDQESNIAVFYEVTSATNSPSADNYYKPQLMYRGTSPFRVPQSERGASVPWNALVPRALHPTRLRRTLISSFFRNYPDLNSFVSAAGPNLFLYEIDSSTSSPVVTDPGKQSDGKERVHALEFRTKDGQTLDPRRIQGGTVSPAGHLYISCDLKLSEGIGGGVHGFDLVTGRRVIHLPVDGNQEGIGGRALFELEGLTVWDVDSVSNAHSTSQGQLHLTVLKPRLGDRDQIWVLHWRVTASKRERI